MKHRILLGVGILLMVAALYMVCIFVPTDAETGIVQRIFYIHVPLAWVALLAFIVVFYGSVMLLWRRDNEWYLWPPVPQPKLGSSSPQCFL